MSPADRPFTDSEARDAWNEGADAWLAFLRSGADYYRLHVHGPALLEACGDVTGLRALDIGSGEGYFARRLAGAGAHVTGVELAERLVAAARAEEQRAPLGIAYHHMSAGELGDPLEANTFDLITACMAIQDMADPGAVLRHAARLLHARGRMVFSIPHPCTDTPVRQWERAADGSKVVLRIDRYFDAGPTTCDWNMPRLEYHWQTPYWRKTLEQWSGMIAHAGFLIRRLHEPHPDPTTVATVLQLEDCGRLPYFLIFDLIKADRGR